MTIDWLPFFSLDKANKSSPTVAHCPLDAVRVTSDGNKICILPFNDIIQYLFIATTYILIFIAIICLIHIIFIVFFIYSYSFRINLLSPDLSESISPINNDIFKSRGNCLVLLTMKNGIHPFTFIEMLRELANAKQE